MNVMRSVLTCMPAKARVTSRQPGGQDALGPAAVLGEGEVIDPIWFLAVDMSNPCLMVAVSSVAQ